MRVPQWTSIKTQSRGPSEISSGFVLQHFHIVHQIIDMFIISNKGGVRMKMPSVTSQNVSHFISASSSPTPCLLMATHTHTLTFKDWSPLLKMKSQKGRACCWKCFAVVWAWWTCGKRAKQFSNKVEIHFTTQAPQRCTLFTKEAPKNALVQKWDRGQQELILSSTHQLLLAFKANVFRALSKLPSMFRDDW